MNSNNVYFASSLIAKPNLYVSRFNHELIFFFRTFHNGETDKTLELDREKVQTAEIVKEKEPAHTEDMKQLIEVESLMSENLKLTQEITFLNTNAQVNDLESKRMRTELEKSGSKEQEMAKLLNQKDEAITKLNSELMEEKQQNAKILEVKDHALTKASKQLIDMKAQVTIHVQEIVQNVLEINNLKEELANER